ncbi:MAG: hypothetical protein IJ054_06375 [Lachnospiraceae bacterium]|nr:hypothetical protein [Lachnospiraceae bacterium]
MSKIKRIYASEIVAVPYTGSEIQNFEQGEAFWVYAVDGKKVVRTQILSLYPKNLSDAIEQLTQCAIDVLICRNYATKAMLELKKAGFKIYTFDGGAKAAVNAYAEGRLESL